MSKWDEEDESLLPPATSRFQAPPPVEHGFSKKFYQRAFSLCFVLLTIVSLGWMIHASVLTRRDKDDDKHVTVVKCPDALPNFDLAHLLAFFHAINVTRIAVPADMQARLAMHLGDLMKGDLTPLLKDDELVKEVRLFIRRLKPIVVAVLEEIGEKERNATTTAAADNSSSTTTTTGQQQQQPTTTTTGEIFINSTEPPIEIVTMTPPTTVAMPIPTAAGAAGHRHNVTTKPTTTTIKAATTTTTTGLFHHSSSSSSSEGIHSGLFHHSSSSSSSEGIHSGSTTPSAAPVTTTNSSSSSSNSSSILVSNNASSSNSSTFRPR